MKERIAEIRERKAIHPSKNVNMIVLLKLRDTPFIVLEPEERDWLLTRLEEAEKVMKNAVAWTETPEGRAVPQVNGQPGEWIRAARRWLEGEG